MNSRRRTILFAVCMSVLARCPIVAGTASAAIYNEAYEGSCLKFDSDADEVVVQDSESLDLVGEFTLSAWVCPSSLPTSGDWKIISKGTNVVSYFLTVGSNYVRGGFVSDEAPQRYYYAMKNITLPIDRWTHLAVTYDGTQVKVYVNGVLGGSANALGKQVKVTDEALHIAKGFRGKIDQLQIIGRALSAYEVKDEALRGFWGFGDGGGTSASDYSQNGNTAALHNGASFAASGVQGNCLSLDGANGYASVPSSGSLSPYDAITVEAWVKPNVLGSNWSSVAAKGSNSPSYWLAVRNGELAGGFYGADSNLYQASASVSIPTSTWSHVAMTYDGSYVRVFLNGNQMGSSAASGKQIRANNEQLLIGSRTSGENFSGKIDEACVLSTAKNYDIAGMLAVEGAIASLEYGSYAIPSAINMKSNQTLEGRGPDRTLLRLNDAVNDPVIITYHHAPNQWQAGLDHHITLRDFSIEGNSANNQGQTVYYLHPMGITLMDTSNYTIERVYVRDTRGYAGLCTWPDHYTYRDGQTVIKNYILHCLIENTARPIMETHGGYGSGIFLSGFDQRNTIVGRTTCNYNAGIGIWLEDYQSYMDVVWNTCTNNVNGGIWLNTTGYSNVLHNVAENNGGRGIQVDGGGPVGVQSGSTYNTIAYNTVRNTTWEGIFITDSAQGVYDAYCTFSNNIVEDNNNVHGDVSGIAVQNVRQVTIDGNISRDTRSPRWQYYGIATQGSADYNTITNNDLRYNRVGGLSTVGGNNVISGNQQ